MNRGADPLDALLRKVASAPDVAPDLMSTGDDEERPVVAGRYRVQERLGSGGMGIVYLARDQDLHRELALKVHRGPVRKAEVERLRREAQSMAGLSHPNVLTVYDVGMHEGALYIAMEYAPHGTLRELLNAGSLPWREITQLFITAGEGLKAAHAAGIVHRDFKPDNVLMSGDGTPKVADFGLASLADQTDQDEITPDSDDDVNSGSSPRLTHTGAVLGTPAYMSPEQIAGKDVDARADQFAFCVALFEALYGRRPFPGETIHEIAARVSLGEIQYPPRYRRLPGTLQAALERGLQVDPGARWPDMESLLAALRRGRKRRRAPIYVGAAAVAIVAGFAVVGGPGDHDCEASLKIGDVWNGEAKREIESSFRIAAAAYAEDAWTRTESAADAYVDALRKEWADACSSGAQGEGEASASDQRFACLRSRRAELSALVDVLRKADARSVEGAVDAATTLPSAARCDSAAAEALPADPETALAVIAVRQDLATVRVKGQAGLALEAVALAREASDTAEALGYEPLVAEALFQRGASREAHESPAGVPDLEAAYFKAVEVGNDDLAFKAATLLIQGQRGDFEASQRWYESTIAAIHRAGADSIEIANADLQLGMAHYRTGNVKTAAELLRRAIDTFERAGDDRKLIDAFSMLGAVELRAGHLVEAEKHGRRALAQAHDLYGPRHPRTVGPALNLADTLRASDGHKEALEIAERALEIQSSAHGPESLGVLGALEGIASASQSLGDYPRAIEFQEHAVELVRRKGAPPSDQARALGNLAGYYSDKGRHAEALAARKEALKLMDGPMGTPGEVAVLRAAIATGYADIGSYDAAVDAMVPALEALEEALGPDHPNLGLMHLNMALNCASAARIEIGRKSVGEAQRIFTASLPPEHRNHARVLATRAALQAAAGEWEQSLATGRRATARIEEIAGPHDYELVSPFRKQGHALLALGRPRDAIVPLRRAVDLGTSLNVLPALTAKSQFELAQALWDTGARKEARTNAQVARDALAKMEAEQEYVAIVDDWLAKH